MPKHRTSSASAPIIRFAAALALVALVVVLTIAALARRAGGAVAFPANCATATSPYASAAQSVVYSRPGIAVRRYTKAGRSPLFAATADTRYISTGPVLAGAVQTRRQVRDMMGRAYAAINGDFFHPVFGTVGVEVARGGHPIKGTSGYQRSLVTAPDQSVSVAQVKLTLHLNRKISATRTETIGAQSYNTQQAYANGIDVFNSYWGNGATLAKMHWAAQTTRTYLLYRGHVAAIYPGAHARAIPAGGALVVVQGAGLAKVAAWRVGTAVSLSVSVQSNTVRHVWAAVGTGPLIVSNSAAGGGACGYDSATPRTMVGIYPGGHRLVFIAASGRGLTMREAMAFLRSLGVATAVGFDGGGSTVMAVRQPAGPQQLTVHPYVHEGDRPVPQGIGLYPR